LQPRGFDGASVPYTTVAAAAQACIRDMRRITAGPYRLLGHSFGGWVVFEAACELAAAGERVESIVLVDTQPPSWSACEPHGCGRVDVLTRLVRVIEEESSRNLGITRDELAALDYDAQQVALMRRMQSSGILPRTVNVDTVRNLVRVFSANLNTAYEPARRFDGEVLLIQAQEPSRQVDREDPAGLDQDALADAWQKQAPRLVRVKSPGNHTTMLKEPNVGSIAAHVRRFWVHV
jgi:thioesterase domain-containing protein